MAEEFLPQFDVVCAGLIVADFVCAPISRMPPSGGLITTASLQPAIGGCAANAGSDMARLGLSVALVGCLGDDPFGKYVLDQLQRNRVNCDHVRVSTVLQTAATMVINVKHEDRRFIHAVGANTELTGREISETLLKQSKSIVVGGFGLNPQLSGENVRDLFRTAHSHGVTTLLDVVLDDVDSCREMLKHALPETDFFLPNGDEARLLTGTEAPREQSQYFHELGAKTVVITCGSAGAYLSGNDRELIHQPAFDVEQVDGTGGGDAFLSGFVYGLSKNGDLQNCLLYGSAMGASCVQQPGATTGVFNAVELESFIADHCM